MSAGPSFVFVLDPKSNTLTHALTQPMRSSDPAKVLCPTKKRPK